MRSDGRPLGRGSYPDTEPDELKGFWRRRRDQGKSFSDPRDPLEIEPGALSRISRRKVLGMFALAGIGLVQTGLDVDIHLGKLELSDTTARVMSVYDAQYPYHRHRATLVTAGFGNVNSYSTAYAVPRHAERMNVLATYLDDKGIDIDTIAASTLAYCQERGIRELEFDDYSQGGLVGLATARRLYESEYDIEVPAIHLKCTPSDVDVLREESRDQGYMMTNLLAAFEDAEYSRTARFMVEVFGARWREFLDIRDDTGEAMRKFYNVVRYVLQEKILNDDAAATTLLKSQFMFIVASGARDDILALGRERENRRLYPDIVYVRPQDPQADKVVDTARASMAFREYCQEANLNYIDVASSDIGHADPKERRREYDVITQVVADVRDTVRRSPPKTSSYLTFPYAYRHDDGNIQHITVSVYPRAYDVD